MTYPHGGLKTIFQVQYEGPKWGVFDWGVNEQPEARLVAQFFNFDEAAEYAHVRHERKCAAGAQVTHP